MKYVLYLLILAACIPGMGNMIDWALDLRSRWWKLKLLAVMVFLSAFVALGSLVYFRLWRR